MFFFASGIHVETNLPEIQDNVTYNCSGRPRNKTNPARHMFNLQLEKLQWNATQKSEFPGVNWNI